MAPFKLAYPIVARFVGYFISRGHPTIALTEQSDEERPATLNFVETYFQPRPCSASSSVTPQRRSTSREIESSFIFLESRVPPVQCPIVCQRRRHFVPRSGVEFMVVRTQSTRELNERHARQRDFFGFRSSHSGIVLALRNEF